MKVPKAGEPEDPEEGVHREGEPGKHKDHPPGAAPRSTHCCNSIGDAEILSLLRKFPHLLVAPAILFCLIVALCTFGLVHSTNNSYLLEKEQAIEAALKASDGLALQLSSASKAALSLTAVVKMNPNWSFLDSNFHVLAEELFRQSNEDANTKGTLSLMELTLLPFGRVRASLGKPIQRNSTADLFSPEFIDKFMTLEAVENLSGLHVQGPVTLTNSENLAFTFGYPIFFDNTDEDEGWEHPDNITHPTNCSGPPCYMPETRRKYWGSIGSLVNAEPILSGKSVHLERLVKDDLSYVLTINRPTGTSGASTLVSGGSFHPNKVTATVNITLPGNSWELSVYNPCQEEILALRDGLIAMVVILAFILSGLLLLLLLSSKKASVLYKEQLVTNRLLQEEKVSREALLGRQLDLIACFEQGTKHNKQRNTSRLSEGQMNTLDQIASAKAAISDVGRRDDDIQVQELIAEGGFGKVYRGRWRGTPVAVKIIMLPRNMSGREKREKMIVWEAAISSSLVHPNVCQTYHYRIKPVKETAKERSASEAGNVGSAVRFSIKPVKETAKDRSASEAGNVGSTVRFSDLSGSRRKSGIATDMASDSSGPEEVHSYEVQLILEYCDKASLRDALDAGMFITPKGMNYAAQLDCAMEVASAMLHLHCNNVLHLDLKTHNIMLASSGAAGKGVTCKVSDFGLSVRMDHTKTHVSSLFQGTLTHMAPEVMLKGQCCKASDVYAFGIILWELYTGDSPYRDVHPMLLAHSVVKDNKRPTWPAMVPKGYRDLAEACWDKNSDSRPTFGYILKELQRLRDGLGSPTAPLQPYPKKQPPCRTPHFQETFGSLSQPSFTMVQSRDSRDFLQAMSPSTQAAFVEQQAKPQAQGGNGSVPQAKGIPSPSQAALLEQAWMSSGRKASAPQAEAPSGPTPVELEQAWSRAQRNAGAPEVKSLPPTPSPAELEQAWTQPRGNGALLNPSPAELQQACMQPQGNGGPLQAKSPLNPSAAELEQAWMQPRGNGSSPDPSLAELQQAWMQPQGNGGPPEAKGPSPTPSPAELEQAWLQLQPQGNTPPAQSPSHSVKTPSQAAPLVRGSSAPSLASSDSTLALGLTNPEGTLSASLAREGKEEEEKAQSTNPGVCGNAGQGGLNHPQLCTHIEGHEGMCYSDVPIPLMPGSSATSTPSATQGQLSLDHRSRSATSYIRGGRCRT